MAALGLSHLRRNRFCSANFTRACITTPLGLIALLRALGFRLTDLENSQSIGMLDDQEVVRTNRVFDEDHKDIRFSGCVLDALNVDHPEPAWERVNLETFYRTRLVASSQQECGDQQCDFNGFHRH